MRSVRAAVFLDRDGTINEDPGFVHRAEQLVLFEGVGQALAALKQAGYLLVVVTNQSGIARGLYSETDVHLFHDHLNATLAPLGAEIDAFYFCPFHPQAELNAYRVDSPNRKPNIGMFEQACRDLGIDPSRSYMIGDRLTDMTFGKNAGLRSILVKTGQGIAAADASSAAPFTVAEDLPAAAALILNADASEQSRA